MFLEFVEPDKTCHNERILLPSCIKDEARREYAIIEPSIIVNFGSSIIVPIKSTKKKIINPKCRSNEII